MIDAAPAAAASIARSRTDDRRQHLPRIAVLGAGHVGPVIARIAVESGYHVAIASSGDPERIELVAQVLAPGAEARSASDAVEGADVVVLAIPSHRFPAIDPALLANRIVVDAMNYWPSTDGHVQMFEDRRHSSSEIVQRRLHRSTVVKALNHLGYYDLDIDRRPADSTERLALAVAGDDPLALETVATMIERIGYDTVRLDRLADGCLLEPGGPVFGRALPRRELALALGRPRDGGVTPATQPDTHQGVGS
jgi:predicted dinucleotide-binding enzyme